MSDWDWEYVSDADHIVGGLTPELRAEAERLARRLADAASVKYLSDPPIEDSGVSSLQSHAEGAWLMWFIEHRRPRVVFITAVQYLGAL